MISKSANAKINLILDLTSKLENGYHAIYTVMQSVSLRDEVSAEKSDDGKIHITCSDISVPCDERNTAYKAAERFFSFTKIPGGVHVNIEKNIPHCAGLAGGSADAAAVIEILSELYEAGMSISDKKKIALEVGADVPFCLEGGTRLCLNFGEITVPVFPFECDNIVISKPFSGVSTKSAYAVIDNSPDIRRPDNDSFLYYAARGDYRSAFSYSLNVFEQALMPEDGEKIRKTMLAHGAYYCAMSGSGSAYFGFFSSPESAAECAAELDNFTEFSGVYSSRPRGIE